VARLTQLSQWSLSEGDIPVPPGIYPICFQYRDEPVPAKPLKEDSSAKAKCGELIGIDFVPFVMTQDPAERHEVGEITQANGSYKAGIYRVDEGQRGEKFPCGVCRDKWALDVGQFSSKRF